MMNARTISDRRFYRDRDSAILGGVCAGLAEHLGFNLKVTRTLAFIAFLMAMPVAVIVYLAAVFLVPSASLGTAKCSTYRCSTKKRRSRKGKKADRAPFSSAAADINQRCLSLDERLRRLEKHITSPRFQLDQELSKL